MKKIVIILLMVLFCTGCNSESLESKKFDKDTAKEKIADLTFNNSEFKFDDSENINNMDALSVYGVDLTLLNDYLFYLSSDVVDPSMYLVVNSSEENKSVVKYQIEELFNKYYNSYNNYYPKEAKMIEDRLEKEYEDYLIYIVSYDNDKVYQAIEESFK